MTSAISALLGVIVGGLLSIAKDWWFENRKTKRNLEYLSIQVISELDQFIKKSYAVVIDDGLFQGGYDTDGCKAPQVSLPKFNRESIDGIWKSLPTTLMYEIWSFPYEIEKSNEQIDNVIEYSSFPPEYIEVFKERYYQYSTLALKANQLRDDLSKLCNFPVNTFNGSMIVVMKKIVSETNLSREKNYE